MSSRLGKTLSPERDASSLKTKALRLSESSNRNQGKVLQTRLGRNTNSRHCSNTHPTYISYQKEIQSIACNHSSTQAI